MSYTTGTTLGRLRETIGDIDADELFSDAQLNDYLAQCDNIIGYAAARALRRIANDPDLLRRKFNIFGRMDAMTFTSLQRNLLDQARMLENTELAARAPVDISPEKDSGDAYTSTDADGWHVDTDLDTYILDQETKE